MTQDARMSESLPAVPIRPADRHDLSAKARETFQREDPSIEKIALALALGVFQRTKDLERADQREALYLQSAALRRAAELVDERLQMSETKRRA